MSILSTTRRTFLGLAGAALSTTSTAATAATTPPVSRAKRRTSAPWVLASGNGHEFRNGGPRTCVEEAWLRIARLHRNCVEGFPCLAISSMTACQVRVQSLGSCADR